MIYTSINYDALSKQMIAKCIKDAREYPFKKHYFICDNPEIIEQAFFEHTSCLVNIEVLTFNDFLKQMIIEYHYNQYTIISRTKYIYLLRDILLNNHFDCFHSDNPYPLIEKFIPVLKDFELYELDYNTNNRKLNDLLSLYKLFKSKLNDYEFMTLESLFDQCDFNIDNASFYIDGNHLYNKKQINIINKLKKYHNVDMYYIYDKEDSRLFNLPYHRYIDDCVVIDHYDPLLNEVFKQNVSALDYSDEQYYFRASSLEDEVCRAVYSIYCKVVDEDLCFNDFIIVYPSDDYEHILIKVLDSLNIPHHMRYKENCVFENTYRKIINDHNCKGLSSFKAFARYFLSFNPEPHYVQYFNELLLMDDEISYDELIEFFKYSFNKEKFIENKNSDYVQVCKIDKVDIYRPKHMFVLGMNETVLPKAIKDTGLLLDEDLDSLDGFVPFNCTEQLGVHYNDILRLLSFDTLSRCFSYPTMSISGEVLLESSLFKQLNKMLGLKLLAKPEFLSDEEVYLNKGMYEDKVRLNEHISRYIGSKNQVDSIDPELIKDIYSSHLSVSQLETYNKCPFMYFIKYGLKIVPMYSKELQANELGSLVHYILEKCIDSDCDINDIADEYIRDNEILARKINESLINQYFIDLLKEDMKMTLYILRKQKDQSLFSIYDKELKINDSLIGLSFKGFVDRVDMFEDYISIMDYKSSSKDIDLNLAMQGFNIQMLVYLKMVSESLDKIPGAVLYFNTKKRILKSKSRLYEPVDEDAFFKEYKLSGYVVDDECHDVIHAIDTKMDKASDVVKVKCTKSGYSGNILTKDQLYKLFGYIEEHISELYTSMISGCIGILPKGSDQSTIHASINPCTYCDYKSVCQFDHFYNEYTLVEINDVDSMLGGEDDGV